jgi:hypothetical protein
MSCSFDVIPHFDQGYLNSILISLIYNTSFKDLITNKFIYNDFEKNLFKKLIKYLLENNSNPLIYKRLNAHDLLLSLELKSNKYTTWVPDYITKIYSLLNISFLTIIYDAKTNKYLLDSSSIIDPDVIILYHSELNKKSNVFISKFKEFYKTNPDKALEFEGTSKGINFKGIDTYDEEISVNDNIYEISSCILTNNNATIGFFCNKEKYVYNYFNSPDLSTCAIVKYDWNLKRNDSKCFSTETCKIKSTNCFSFFKDEKLIIYIKKKKEITENPKVTAVTEEVEDTQDTEEVEDIQDKEDDEIQPDDIKSVIKSKTIKEVKEVKDDKDDKDYIIKLLVSKLKGKDVK